jgi:hypothetical protein
MTWPSYDLSVLNQLPIPIVDGVVPGKHTTRKGWLTKDFHYEQSPYTSDVNAAIWKTQFGEMMSLRTMASRVAWYFRQSIRKYSDPFSMRLLFAILSGRAPSLLELADRPAAYEDVGHLCRWGSVIDELAMHKTAASADSYARRIWEHQSIDEYVVERTKARQVHMTESKSVSVPQGKAKAPVLLVVQQPARTTASAAQRAGNGGSRSRVLRARRRKEPSGGLIPQRTSEYLDRRGTSLLRGTTPDRERRRANDRRRKSYNVPFPDRRLTRSAYEQVFLQLVSGRKLRMGGELYSPVGMKGWYHAIFRRDSDGAERLLSIDQLLSKMKDWQ